MLKFSSHRGFSILMALGVTAVLMIVVTGLAAMYARELKISRLSYDEVLVQASAEGMFEYGMLKIKNHEAGFADEVKSSLPDWDTDMFKLLSDRSKWLEMDYKIDSQTGSYIGKIPENGFLTIPLFVAKCDILTRPENCKPDKNANVIDTKDIKVTGLNENSSWTISAMNDGKTVALQGVGEISSTSTGTISLMRYHCFYIENETSSGSFESNFPCKETTNEKLESVYNQTDLLKYIDLATNSATSAQVEETLYPYELTKNTVQDFLADPKNSDPTKVFWEIEVIDGETKDRTVKLKREFPYLTIYNNSNISIDVNVGSNDKFSLPTYTITSTAKKGDASQVFTLSQDKGSSLDILKFGYYGQ